MDVSQVSPVVFLDKMREDTLTDGLLSAAREIVEALALVESGVAAPEGGVFAPFVELLERRAWRGGRQPYVTLCHPEALLTEVGIDCECEGAVLVGVVNGLGGGERALERRSVEVVDFNRREGLP